MTGMREYIRQGIRAYDIHAASKLVMQCVNSLRRFATAGLLVLFWILAVAILVFIALEIPFLRQRVSLKLPYYFVTEVYDMDPELVFTYRFTGQPHTVRTLFRGDLFSPWYGVHVEPVPAIVNYGANGFRANSSSPPWDVAVIGDSFVEIGKTDDSTFSEQLADITGMSTYNLGMAWYGPNQYVELLRRFAAPLEPRFVLVMFYGGNDIGDILQYERWRAKGRYWAVDRRYWEAPLPRRFAIALGQAGTWFIRHSVQLPRIMWSRLTGREGPYRSHLAQVRLGKELVPMVVAPWSRDSSALKLYETREWRALHGLMEEARSISARFGARPIFVYVPTKAEAYADLISPESGRRVRELLPQQRRLNSVRAEAMATLAHDVGVCFVDLLPHFQRLAARGELLYHPFDTHWNRNGRTEAASLVAGALGWRPDPDGSESVKC
jgi:hypothetical protein